MSETHYFPTELANERKAVEVTEPTGEEEREEFEKKGEEDEISEEEDELSQPADTISDDNEDDKRSRVSSVSSFSEKSDDEEIAAIEPKPPETPPASTSRPQTPLNSVYPLGSRVQVTSTGKNGTVTGHWRGRIGIDIDNESRVGIPPQLIRKIVETEEDDTPSQEIPTATAASSPKSPSSPKAVKNTQARKLQKMQLLNTDLRKQIADLKKVAASLQEQVPPKRGSSTRTRTEIAAATNYEAKLEVVEKQTVWYKRENEILTSRIQEREEGPTSTDLHKKIDVKDDELKILKHQTRHLLLEQKTVSKSLDQKEKLADQVEKRKHDSKCEIELLRSRFKKVEENRFKDEATLAAQQKTINDYQRTIDDNNLPNIDVKLLKDLEQKLDDREKRIVACQYQRSVLQKSGETDRQKLFRNSKEKREEVARLRHQYDKVRDMLIQRMDSVEMNLRQNNDHGVRCRHPNTKLSAIPPPSSSSPSSSRAQKAATERSVGSKNDANTNKNSEGSSSGSSADEKDEVAVPVPRIPLPVDELKSPPVPPTNTERTEVDSQDTASNSDDREEEATTSITPSGEIQNESSGSPLPDDQPTKPPSAGSNRRKSDGKISGSTKSNESPPTAPIDRKSSNSSSQMQAARKTSSSRLLTQSDRKFSNGSSKSAASTKGKSVELERRASKTSLEGK